MPKNGQMTKQFPKGSNSTRLRYILLSLSAAVVLAVAVYLVQTYRYEPGAVSADRQSDTEKKWAPPLELPGVPNFHKLSEDLYRGAQPTADGMRQLKKLGIKTVVNLRSFHSDRDEIGETRLAYEHIKMQPWDADDEDVVRFLKIVTDPNRTPVFVHCHRGADRTGTMCAVYRIAVQGWTKPEAIEEMTKGGFGFYPAWQNLVNYILNLDIKEIRTHAGLTQ